MKDLPVGSGVRPLPGRRPSPYLSRKPNPIGDRGVRLPACERARWVTVVSTLGAWTEERLSPALLLLPLAIPWPQALWGQKPFLGFL